jgi:L-fuculose-phosphate aldolase
MLLREEREKIIQYGKKLVTSGLTKGTGGNLSIYNPEKKLVAIKPSGIDYFEIQLEDIVIVDLDGNIVEGHRTPSSEISMHLIFYKERDDIQAVVHCHSVFASTMACMNWELPALHYLVAFAGPDVRVSPYATFGTKPLAENAFEAMKDRKAVLLANHGLLTGADCIENAFNIAEEIEFCCELYCRCKSMGEPVILPDEEMTLMKERFRTYGQAKK